MFLMTQSLMYDTRMTNIASLNDHIYEVLEVVRYILMMYTFSCEKPQGDLGYT